MNAKHVIEVIARPYTLGNPRRYYADDYAVGSLVIDNGITYRVQVVDGVMMFVAI